MRNSKRMAAIMALVLSVMGPMTVYGQEMIATTPYEGEKIENTEEELFSSDVKFDLTEEMLADKMELSEIAESMQADNAGEDYVENEIIYFADTQEEAEKIAEGYKGVLKSYQEGVAVANVGSSTQAVVAVASDLDVELPAVYPNFIYTTDEVDGFTAADQSIVDTIEAEIAGNVTAPNDPDISKQWFHDNISTFAAWNVTKGSGVTVAVIDSGIDSSHKEFAGRVTALTRITGSTDTNDNLGHGTHVAGIIAAAANNDLGGCGVAPEAKIISIKALEVDGSGGASGSTADIAAAVRQANSLGVQVINMSLGGGAGGIEDILFQKTINESAEAGIVVVVAAGNEATNIADPTKKVVPACFDNVIAVSALQRNDTLSSFSNYGAGIIDIAAPGGNATGKVDDIYSCYKNGGYTYMGGTSMASPVVSGVVALIIGAKTTDITSQTGIAKVEAVRRRLGSSAKNIGSSAKFGAGIANAAAAVGELSITSRTQHFEVATGKSIQLVAAYTTAQLAKNVTWSSSDTKVATVTKGKVLAAKNISEKKTVVITATTADTDKKTTSVTVTVFPVTSAKISMTGKQQYNFFQYARDGGNFIVTAGDMPIVYSSSNEKVAIVDRAGYIGAQSRGKAIITAKTLDGKQSLTCKVNVATPLVLNFICSKNKAEEYRYSESGGYYPVAAGTSINLSAYTSQYNLINFPTLRNPTNKKVNWAIDNTSAATIKNGRVTASESISAPTTITIKAEPADGCFGAVSDNICIFDPITAISFDSTSIVSSKTISLSKGETYDVIAYIYHKTKGGTCYEVVNTSSSKPSVVDVNSGKLTALKAGTAKITVKALDGTNKKAVLTVKVK